MSQLQHPIVGKIKILGRLSNKLSGIELFFLNRLAEIVEQYLKKGSKIYVEGQLRTNSWEDKNTGEKKFRTEIVAREMQMLSSRGEMSQQNQDSGFDQSPQNTQEESVPWDDDDIPF